MYNFFNYLKNAALSIFKGVQSVEEGIKCTFTLFKDFDVVSRKSLFSIGSLFINFPLIVIFPTL